MNPTEALSVSNKITYGKKWTIFLGNLILGIILVVAIYILVLIFGSVSDTLGIVVGIIGYIAMLVIMMAAAAYIYGALSKELDAI